MPFTEAIDPPKLAEIVRNEDTETLSDLAVVTPTMPENFVTNDDLVEQLTRLELSACHRNIHSRSTAVQPEVRNVGIDTGTERGARYRGSMQQAVTIRFNLELAKQSFSRRAFPPRRNPRRR